MKNKIFLLTFLIALTSLSCEEFLDVNTDPNNPVYVTPDLILPVGQVYTARYMQSGASPDRSINILGNMMMFNWGESYGFSWYDEEFQYLVTSTFYDYIWDGQYRDALKQYDDLKNFGDEYGYYKAIGEIMKAYHFQLLVDMYGDVPYSNAMLRGENPTPTYDDAETIYLDLIVKLNEAVEAINVASEDPLTEELDGNSDVMFGGDMTAWKQFAHTLKVRILTRYSDVASAAFIQSELDAIDAEGSGYIVTDVTVQPGFVQEAFKQNYYWDQLGWDVGGTVRLSNDATCATQYVLDYLTNTNDPRIGLIYEEPATGHLGVDQGAPNNDEGLGADYVSNIGPGHLKGPDMPAVILTLAEHNFNMAELAHKVLGMDAEAYYVAGVTASYDYLLRDVDTTGMHLSSIGLYLSQALPNVSWEFSPDKLEAIITQKWIATNGITAEQSWFDYSRTGFPANLPVSERASTPDRPVRLVYPNSEVTGNSANMPAQPDAFNDNIFWAN